MRHWIMSGASIGLSCFLAACVGQGTSIVDTRAEPPAAARKVGSVISLPGLQYEVLRSVPAGARPLRSDDVSIRYIGRLNDGSIFSTSSENGAQPSTFSVRTVIPGFSALVQLMRPGDRWRFTIPAYLGYGHQGRRFTPPEDTLKRDIPPGSILIFDVELVAIIPAR
ncbi:MAG: FKBP-type peptidyl-prolyl cis-trans isomerase [Sphingomicrobium sp.]